jgi:hypothetical protein
MATTLQDQEISQAFNGAFKERLAGEWKEWKNRYVDYLLQVDKLAGDTWLSLKVQQTLWESTAITGVGPGSSVTVEGAYSDVDIAAAIQRMRTTELPTDTGQRGQKLDGYYDWLLEAVAKYNDRQPKARVKRLLAGLFPRDVSCIVNTPALRSVLKLVEVVPARGTGRMGWHVLLLQRLRKVLGDPQDLSAIVDQSMFCWYLWRTYCDKPEEGSIAASSPTATDVPSLSLLPVNVQRRGLSYVQQNVSLLVAVVREAEQGITRQDLIAVILREAPHLKAAGSASITISQAQGGLSLIGLSDGAYRPTDHGRELLTAPDPREVLQPLLIGRVFGMGQLLLALSDAPQGKGQKEVAEYVAGLYPTRKSTWAGNELVQWGLATNLIWRQGSTIGLTEDGVAYASALPPDFLSKWRIHAPGGQEETETDDAETESEAEAEPATEELQAAALDALRDSFAQGEFSSQLIVGDTLLTELHAALHATKHKRFVLLAGLSGTGKTSITRAYAEAYCKAIGIGDWKRHYRQVAVRPDWTDPTGLLGFVNALSDPPSYQLAETLTFLLQADRDRRRPYFLCLDEMNLARAEHYFAPFLSAMESPATGLRIHAEAAAIDNVEPLLAWPQNLFIFGTVNMDESTHAFSDKVLDRAFTFEFCNVDLSKWEQKWRGKVDGAALDRVAGVLVPLYTALLPARRHFGYRTADEVLSFCLAAGSEPPSDAVLDAAILMKVLPRVRGDDSGPLSKALEAIEKITAPFDRSLGKVRQMREALSLTGQARFWS